MKRILAILFLLSLVVFSYSQEHNMPKGNFNFKDNVRVLDTAKIKHLKSFIDSLNFWFDGEAKYIFKKDTLNASQVDIIAKNFISGIEDTDKTIYVSEDLGSDVTGDGSEINPYQTLDFALNSLRRVFVGADIIVQCAEGSYAIKNQYSFIASSSTLTIRGVVDTVEVGLSPTDDPTDNNRKLLNDGYSHQLDTFVGFFAQKSVTDYYPIFKSDASAVFVAKRADPFSAITRNITEVDIPTESEFNIRFEGAGSTMFYEKMDIYLEGSARFENKSLIETKFCNIYTDASEVEGFELNGLVKFNQSHIFVENPTGKGIDLISNQAGTNYGVRLAITGSGTKTGIAIQVRTERYVTSTSLHIRNFEQAFGITSNGGFFELVSTGVTSRMMELNRMLDIYYGAAHARRIDDGDPIILDDVDYVVYNRTPTIYSNTEIHFPDGTFQGTPNTAWANFTNSVVPEVNSYINLEGLPLITSIDTIEINNSFTYKGNEVDEIYPDTIPNKAYVDSVRYFMNEIIVGTGSQYTSIKDAMASITDNDSVNRYTIKTLPGIFNEDGPIKFKDYVSLVSSGGIGTSSIANNNSGNLFEFDFFNAIDGFTITGTETAISIDSIGNNQISNIIFNSVDTAVSITSPGFLFIDNIYFASGTQKIDVGFYQTNGNLDASKITVSNNDSVSAIFSINGSNSIATITRLATFSTNVDTAIYSNDTSSVVSNICTISNAKIALSANQYSEHTFNGHTHMNIQDIYTDENNGGKLIGYSKNDDNDPALIVEGQEFDVGSAGNGFEVCLGEGDSYSDDLIAYMYNGTSYWEVSDSLKDIDQIGVSFPNLNINTALYLASDVGDSLRHYGVKLAIIDSMTVGSGEVVLEYWDGSAWTEFNGMTTDSDEPFAPRAKDYFEQTQNNHIRYDIVMTNSDDWIANDDPGRGVDKKYIRFRIATAITESGSIDQIKLHPPRLEANANGFIELFGNARHTGILELNIGSGQPFEGNMQNQTIYVDEDIGVGYQDNRFTATADKLGYPINLPDNIDTGCPVTLVFSGRPSSTASITWTIKYVIVSPGQTLYTSEPSASGNSQTVTVTQSNVAGENTIYRAVLDISDAFSTRPNGSGDQIWLSINPSTLTGQFDLTNVGASYFTWGEGGAYTE